MDCVLNSLSNCFCPFHCDSFFLSGFTNEKHIRKESHAPSCMNKTDSGQIMTKNIRYSNFLVQCDGYEGIRLARLGICLHIISDNICFESRPSSRYDSDAVKKDKCKGPVFQSALPYLCNFSLNDLSDSSSVKINAL
jgi:hypothetical protein